MANCVLFGERFSIPDSFIRNYVMDERSWEASEAAEEEFDEWYKKCSSINIVLKGYKKIASELIEKYAFVPLFSQLASLNIYDISEDMYVQEIISFKEVNDMYECVESDLEDIDDDKNEKIEYRAARKANRNRFVGGGFGFSGAIKGSMEAGALNAVSGLAHSSVNTIGNIGTSIGSSMKKSALYNDNGTQETLRDGISLAISHTYKNHKQLVNYHHKYYYEEGFDMDKALALFKNAIKIPDKRKKLLLQAVKQFPAEELLSYIFVNYPEEKENVYQIAQLFGMDFSKYIEESFEKSYPESAQINPDQAEVIKANIVREMKRYGIKTSATLTRLNRDMLFLIIRRYRISLEDGANDQIIKEFRNYDAPKEQKAEIIQESGFWELAKEYGVQYSTEAVELILGRYYSNTAKNDDHEALKAKKKLLEIMNTLSISDSSTYNQLEKNCIKRLCGNIDLADEAQCEQLKQKITEYSALPKNKQEFLDAIQTRLESIWSKEDDQIFDNVYMETNIYDQNQIQRAIDFIKQKGRTASSQKYITALENCTSKNINKAKQYRKKSAKICNAVGIALILLGLACSFIAFPAVVIIIPGIMLVLSYIRKKKLWNILTIEETQIHSMLLNDSQIDNVSSITESITSTIEDTNTDESIKNDSSDTVPSLKEVPLNAYKENRKNKHSMKFGKKRTVVIVLTVLIIVVGVFVYVQNYVQNHLQYIHIVQTSGIPEFSDASYKDAFNEYFTHRKWEHFISTDDESVVEFNGKGIFAGKEAKVTIQFILTEESENIYNVEPYIVDINGEALSDEGGLIYLMGIFAEYNQQHE